MNKPHSPESKKRISESLRGHISWNLGLGKKHSIVCLTCREPKKNAHGLRCGSCYFKSRIGYKHNPESIQKMKEARAKQVFTQETKDKIRQSNLGKKDSLLTRIKKSEARKGKKNPAWRGGLCLENKSERERAMNTLEYKLWRETVFKRDNYTCIFGGVEHGNKLNADHIKPWSLFPELRYEINNGRTLCVDCHRKTDTYAGKILHYVA